MTHPGAGCLGLWCPWCHACQVSADHGEGLCLPLLEMWGGVVPIVGMGIRISVRERYRIKIRGPRQLYKLNSSPQVHFICIVFITVTI